VERNRGKILVIRGGAIGDFILTLPAIAALRSTFPETHLEVLGYPVVAELARRGGLIEGFRSIEARPLAGFFARNGKLDEELSSYFESFSLIFSYLYDPDEIFKTNVLRTTKAQFIQGMHRPDEKENAHATAVFLKPLEKIAIFNADPAPKIEIPAVRRAGRWIAVHPGSGSEKKNWPMEKWVELLKRVEREMDFKILLIGGEADGERVEMVRRALDGRRIELMQNRPLVEVAGNLRGCEVFIGHDSGISHIAGAVGMPALVLWGESKFEIWRPLNANVRILRAPDGELGRLEVEEVWRGMGKLQ
jgi:heptosyltransferase-3